MWDAPYTTRPMWRDPVAMFSAPNLTASTQLLTGATGYGLRCGRHTHLNFMMPRPLVPFCCAQESSHPDHVQPMDSEHSHLPRYVLVTCNYNFCYHNFFYLQVLVV